MAEPNTLTSALDGADLSAIPDVRAPKPPQKRSVGPPRPDQVKPSDFSLDPFSEDDAEETTLESEIPTPKAKEEEKPKTYTHSPRQLNLARHYGIDDAPTMPPPELLQEINAAQLEERALLLEEQRKALVKKEEPKEEEDPIDWGEIDSEDPETGVKVRRKATDKDISSGIVKVVRDQNKLNKELKKTVEELAKREQTKEMEAAYDKVDNAFAALAKDYPKHFTARSRDEFDPNNSDDVAEMTRRVKIMKLTEVDIKVSSGKVVNKSVRVSAEDILGKPNPDDAEEEDDEVLTLPAKKKTAALGPLEQRKKDWAEGGVKKPTHRNVEPKTGDKAALNFLKSKTEEIRGREVEAEAGLPDDLPD